MTYFNDTYDDYIVPTTESITKEQFMAEIKANSNGYARYYHGREEVFGWRAWSGDNDGLVTGEY